MPRGEGRKTYGIHVLGHKKKKKKKHTRLSPERYTQLSPVREIDPKPRRSPPRVPQRRKLTRSPEPGRYSPIRPERKEGETSKYERDLSRRAQAQTRGEREKLLEWVRGRSPVDTAKKAEYDQEAEAMRKRYQTEPPPRPRSAETRDLRRMEEKKRDASQLRRDITELERQDDELRQEKTELHQQIWRVKKPNETSKSV